MFKVGDLVVLRERFRKREDWKYYLKEIHGKTTHDVFRVTEVRESDRLVFIGGDQSAWTFDSIERATPLPPLESFL